MIEAATSGRAAIGPPVALTIAGSDSGGGAGLQADLRTFTACGVHGCVAVTAVTVQNSLGVTGIVEIPPSIVADQVQAVVTDIGVAAAKTGMLAGAAIISAVAGVCDEVGIGAAVPLVVDPVAASMHGDPLLTDDALGALRTELLPRATLVTPNLDEVRLLVGIDVGSRAEQYEAACALHALGPQWVLVKGGHLRDDPECLDLLYDGSKFTAFTGPRLETPHTHGSGDTLAAAITSALARGAAMPEAVGYGKHYIEQAVAHAYPLGAGVGPVSPFWRLQPPDDLAPLARGKTTPPEQGCPRPETDPCGMTIQRVSSRIVYQNPWMQLREDVVRRPDGSQGIYSYVDKPDFALIIPVDQTGFHLVEQYRYPVSHRSWEFPQGTLPGREDGDPTELARRELAEETGLRAEHIYRIGRIYPAKGMSSQACTVFVAEQLETGQHSREHEEQDMRQGQFSQADLEDMIRSGTVTDDATIAAYMLYLLSGPKRTSE